MNKDIAVSAAEHGTMKLYLDHYDMIEFDAVVLSVQEGEEGEYLIQLNQTAFYPGGGGQACDLGDIGWNGGSMELERVFKDKEGIVFHVGKLSGIKPKSGQPVRCAIDRDHRQLNSRLHSAGHLLDLAVYKAGFDWNPGKAAHYPHMCFVEYSGEYDGEKRDEYVQAIQQQIDEIIGEGGQVTPNRVTPEEARQRSKYIPEAVLKRYQNVHLATYNKSFDICCGGTHVTDISSIKKVNIDRIKKKDGNIRVSYSLG